MDEASFRRDRLLEATRRLAYRLRELREEEEQGRRQAAYDQAKAETDSLAEELARLYPPVAAQLADILGRLDANDRKIEAINNRALPTGAERLRTAEMVGRGLKGFGGISPAPRMRDVILPSFHYSPHQRYTWSRR
jgi:hypothetical protein